MHLPAHTPKLGGGHTATKECLRSSTAYSPTRIATPLQQGSLLLLRKHTFSTGSASTLYSVPLMYVRTCSSSLSRYSHRTRRMPTRDDAAFNFPDFRKHRFMSSAVEYSTVYSDSGGLMPGIW